MAIAGLTVALGATSAEAAVTAHVISGHGVAYINVRGAANTSGPVLRTVAGGAAVSLECYTVGQAIVGPYGVSTLWYNLTGGGWVTDALLETGSNSAITRNCATPAPTAGRAWGQTRSANWGVSGQCTWGAYEKFKAYSGVYPALTGNASTWYISAKRTGWTTVLDAQPNAIVVFQPFIKGAGALGHVGWVSVTQRRTDGLYVYVTEMNGPGGLHVWSTRWVKDVAGMSYILAPQR